jgi:hypothetical protein
VFSYAAIEETQYQIRKPLAKFGDAKKQGGEFPYYAQLKAVIERYAAMLGPNHTAGWLP